MRTFKVLILSLVIAFTPLSFTQSAGAARGTRALSSLALRSEVPKARTRPCAWLADGNKAAGRVQRVVKEGCERPTSRVKVARHGTAPCLGVHHRRPTPARLVGRAAAAS